MADLQSLLANLLTPVDKQAELRTKGADMMQLLQGGAGAASAYYSPTRVASMKGSLGSMFGLDMRDPAQKMREQLAANPPDMGTSAGLSQMAQMAQQAGDTAAAAQFGMQAQMVATQEAQKVAATGRTQLQIGTGVTLLDSTLAGTTNTNVKTALGALRAPVASGAISVESLPGIIDKIFTQFKEPIPTPTQFKADIADFVTETGNLVSYRVDEKGLVDVGGKWMTPDAARLVSAPTRATGTTKTETPVSPQLVRALLQNAASNNWITGDMENPLNRSLVDAIESGAVKDAGGVKEWLENTPGTPANIAKGQQITRNTLGSVAPIMRNVEQALNIINDPQSNIGGFYSYLEDYPMDTDAGKFKSVVESIVSGTTFDQIQKMRTDAASVGAVGTGLGGTSEPEFKALGSAIENLKTAQGRPAIEEAMNDYSLHLYNVRNLAMGLPLVVLADDPIYSVATRPELTPPYRTYFEVSEGAVPVEVLVADTTEDALALAKAQRLGK